MQTCVRSAFVLEVQIGGETTYLMVETRPTTSLMAIDRPAATCAKVCLERQDCFFYESLGCRKAHVVATDDYAANTKCESSIASGSHSRADDPDSSVDVSLLHTKCVVHGAQNVLKYTMEPLSECVSGVLAVGLSMRGGGSLSVFRRILVEEIDKRLEILQTPPSTEAARRRIGLCGIFLAREGRQGRCQAAILTTLANGDWKVLGKVQHHCNPLCCSGEDDTRQKFRKFVVPCLAGRMFHIFARSRWNGGFRAVDQQGLFLNMHGLLSIVYTRWAAIMQWTEDKRAQRASAVSPQETFRQESQAFLPREDRPSTGAGWQSQQNPPVDPASSQQCPTTRGSGGDSVEEWREAQRAYRGTALTFLWTAALAGDMLVIMRVVMEPQVELMNDLLYLSSARFEEAQLKSPLEVGHRKFRMSELGTCVLERRLYEKAQVRFKTSEWPVSNEGLHTTLRSMIFRLLARLVATTRFYLQRPHENAPYPLFELAYSPDRAVAEKILGLPVCMRDSFTNSHITAFDTVEKLRSAESMTIIVCIAHLAETDIVARECGHVASRRVRELKSVQTHTLAFADLDTEFVHHQVRTDSGRWCGAVPSVLSNKSQPTKPSSKKRGGAWRAFVHVQGGGGQGLPDMRALVVAYKAFAAEEMAKYVALGEAATVALRSGASSGFAKSASQIVVAPPRGESVSSEGDDGSALAAMAFSSESGQAIQQMTKQVKEDYKIRQKQHMEDNAQTKLALVSYSKTTPPAAERILRECPTVAKPAYHG